MKLKTLIILLLASVTFAQHPMDFVPDDALGILSIKDGSAVNSILQLVNEKSGLPSDTPNVLETYLSQYIDNPSAIDLKAQVLVILVPTVIAPGQRQPGMFGAMPHFMVVCKAKDGQNILANTSAGMIFNTTVEGWFIATGATQWTPRTDENLSPIVATLPDAQISSSLKFGTLWSQFSPIVQMVGGMAVGGLNKPGPDGVIAPETKQAAKAAKKAFAELVKQFGDVEGITSAVNFDSHTVIANVHIESKSGKNPTIDNSSMLEMASLVTNSASQYAISDKLTRKLMKFDFASLYELAGEYGGGFLNVGPEYAKLAELTEANVVSCDLTAERGLTLSVLADVQSQEEYMQMVPEVVVGSDAFLERVYNMELTPADAPFAWNVSMLTSDSQVQLIMDAIIKKEDQIRFGKYGTDRVSIIMFGPRTWKPFSQPHASAISQLIKPHAKNVEIDFAMSFDPRKFAKGFIDTTQMAYDEVGVVEFSASPSAKNSLLFGTTSTGTLIELKSDLYGMATLIADLQRVQAEAKANGTSIGAGIGALAGQSIGGKGENTKIGPGIRGLTGNQEK
ncbi:MAG: glycine zipper family protein [Phycisphaerae bacterium]|jgi:hypothetical protein|nr:glycine zipper family protein [Phycisphaerae bacterium]